MGGKSEMYNYNCSAEKDLNKMNQKQNSIKYTKASHYGNSFSMEYLQCGVGGSSRTQGYEGPNDLCAYT